MTQKTSTLLPLENRVVLKYLDQEDTVKGGIILPDSAKKKQATALVLAIGPGSTSKEGTLLPMPVQVGNKVLIDKYSGQEVTINEETLVVVRATDIIAIVN